MELVYKIELKGRSLLVRLEERGSRRVLYLDRLRAIAKESDQEALALLVKIQLQTTRNPETLSFQQIVVPPSHVAEALRLMRKTGRLVGEVAPTSQAPLTLLPKLKLRDTSGCFADLWMDYGVDALPFEDFAPTVQGRPRLKQEERAWEKDLLEAGYVRKIVGDSHYYCPTERVKEALQLLLDVGWKIEDPLGQPFRKQAMEIREEGGRIAIRGPVRALLDAKMQMIGHWEGETLYLKKSQMGALVPLLDSQGIDWEERLHHLASGLKQGASVETALPGPTFSGRLLPYQQKGVDWMHFLYRWGFSGLLADEMGLGKTVQVLAFLSRLGTNLPILIVAPTSLLFHWRAEIARFLSPPLPIELISYTTLRLNVEEYAGRFFEAIILDESTAIKTATTQTARAAYKLQARFKLCLNGTPVENRPDELWSQLHFLMPDLIDQKMERQQIRPFILRRRKEEVQLDLPEKVEQVVWIEMGEAQRELYDSYRKGVRIDGMNRMQILEVILRLRQICADPRLVGSSVPGAKMEQLLSDLQETLQQERKVLVYSQFTSMLRLVREEFPTSLYLDGSTDAAKRGELVRAFQEDPARKLFLLSLKAGGVGLNLTAAETVFLLDPWWNDAVERQAIDRAHRIGQKKTVFAKRYLIPGSIEEKILQLKAKKSQTADQLLDFDGWTHEDLLYLLT